VADQADQAEEATRIAGPPVASAAGLAVTFGPYRLLERIGAGGMGVVYRAQDTRLNRDLALKVLTPAYRTDPEFGRRFLLEARAASALDHPNCCPVYDIGTAADGSAYIAMAYCEGESVEQRLKRGPLPLAAALAVARQVAAGLGAAHAKGIIHRDIKAANVMVAPDGHVRILDFGIAKMSGTDLTSTGVLVGTIVNMAPEQFSSGAVDARTDCWALGVLLYEMLTGHKPFAGQSAAEVMHRILTERPRPLGQWLPAPPPGLEQLLDRALSRDPAGRFATMDALAGALSALEEGPGPARAAPAPATRGTWRRATLVVVPMILTVLAGALWFVRGGLGPDHTLTRLPEPPRPADAPATPADGPATGAALTASDPSAAARPAFPARPQPLATDRAELSPLAQAVWGGDAVAVRRLLAAGADPDHGDPPPLVAAVVGARPDLVRLLLAAGATPDVRDHEGTPALVLAGLTPGAVRLELVRTLLAMGAEIGAVAPSGITIEALGRQLDDTQVLGLLRQSRTDPAFLTHERAEILARVARELSAPEP
jgi:hypothetical protein